MTTHLSVKKRLARFLTVLCAVVMTVCLLPFEAIPTAAEDVEYIYLDLYADYIQITSTTYSGAIFETVNGTTTKKTVTGEHKPENRYYIYQSSAKNKSTTGLVDGVMILPEYTSLTVDGQSWRSYITNNTDITGIIAKWDALAAEERTKIYSNNITISAGGTTVDITIDSLWTMAHASTGGYGGGIMVTNASTANTHVTVRLKGENRMSKIYYYTGGTTTSSLTFTSADGDKKHTGSLTVIGVQDDLHGNGNYSVQVAANHWMSVIGGSDSYDAVRGLKFAGGTIYAGATPIDNCTAIGGGGNGIGQVFISGGTVTAVAHTTGTAIGGGIAHTSYGGTSDVRISGGTVYAYNFGQPAYQIIKTYGSGASEEFKKAAAHIPGTAIGGGSSILESGNKTAAKVSISGGYVYAESLGGCAIGGGNSVNTSAGSAEITISGGTVIARSTADSNYGTYSDGTTIKVPASVAIGGGKGGINGNGGVATLKISGGTIRAGSIGGGATTNPTGTIGYAEVTISGGTTSGQFIMAAGGSKPCTLTMTDGIIDNGSRDASQYIFLQENGGAIYMDDPNGVVNISGGTIQNCNGENGGAVYMSGGTFTLSGTGTINNCTANANGGAAYLGGTGDAVLNINGGSIQNNSANNGGGLYLASGKINMTAGTVKNNDAESNGGGAYLGGGTLTMSGGAIQNNQASHNGGGAYLGGGALNISSTALIQNNTAFASGGGAFVNGGTLTMNDTSSIQNNTALSNGGGAYVSGGTLTMNGQSTSGHNEAKKSGGGAYVSGGDLTMNDQAAIQHNAATNNGGGAYVSGGNLYIKGGDLTINDDESVIQHNTATNGGGAYVSGGNVDVIDGSISYNTATNDGGGIYVANGDYKMIGGHVDRNTATAGSGGGIYVTASGSAATVEICSGSISYNTVGTHGGAFSVTGDKYAILPIKVTIGVNKYHTINGSNVSCDHTGEGEEEINNCPVIEGNVAPDMAGAIYIFGNNDYTNLYIYCLIETQNQVAEGGEQRGVFLKLEGGRVLISTAELTSGTGDTADDYNHHAGMGYIDIENTVYITNGYLTLAGEMVNPYFQSPITVDVVEGQGDYRDFRPQAHTYYKLIYFENFTDVNGVTSGQYTAYQIQNGEEHTISGNIYNHPGYEISGWYENQNGTGQKYTPVNDVCIFDGSKTDYLHPGDLILYASWEVLGYSVVFVPNPLPGDTVTGTMPAMEGLEYDKQYTLLPNAFVYQGYIFLGWLQENTTSPLLADQANIINLTTEKDAVVQLIAQWKPCEHKASEVTFTFSASGNTLTRTCVCRGYWQKVTISAQNATYDENPHGATLSAVVITSVNEFRPSISENPWTLPSIDYSGTNLLGYSVPVNAGTYTASITEGDATASVVYRIFKAAQAAPNKPTYTVDESQDPRIITIFPSTEDNPKDYQYYEYRLYYFNGDDLVYIDWDDLDRLTLDMLYTNYYVQIRYGETMNYLASAATSADQTYYYGGNVAIFTSCVPGLYVKMNHGDGIDGIYIYVYAEEGHYRSNTSIIVESIRPPGSVVQEAYPKIDKKDSSWFHMYNIPSTEISIQIYLDVSGVRTSSSITPAVDEDHVFTPVDSDTAVIGRDSGFTARFEVENYYAYTDLALEITDPSTGNALSLPQGTTLLLQDLNDGSFWYTHVDSPASVLYLKNFIALGGTTLLGDPNANTNLSVSLHYQVIVDFSQTANGMAPDLLAIRLTATQNSTQEPEVPPLVEAPIQVTLEDVTFALHVQNPAVNLKSEVITSFAQSTGVLSKWKHRSAALVVVPQDDFANLPPDLHLEVVENLGTKIQTTNYYLNAENQFIISVSQDATSLELRLVSELTPLDQVLSHAFDIHLYASRSRASRAPMLGTARQTVNSVTFHRAAAVKPSLRITGDTGLYRQSEPMRLTVEYDMPDDYALFLVVMRKADTGNDYTNTGQSVDDLKNKEDHWIDDPSGANKATLVLPLAGQRNGSYCLVITVRDATGTKVMEIPYYFVIYDS